ncbi:MAG: 23S rRNA (uracil(747)-C(5))-methyltransferase RlmC [Sulfuricurvum sp.]|uniref:23S rRNA (uracil(747)-C(5))-methyltransferase RlmC n=1 Tax=Sulfuricurvum sp. TaxID=2025608 RepID=UPI00261C413A|nr:23S rRNA (uracil(747)-C(5))-methyltransferase RlmC [Sulfuricurvum sp.]MDD2828464.1 23S rRNA (uracil(747)-C(5))-methyltransferase RlmC [Sulfuricurvum sp.]MDD4949005.1 23S rRNA (uracil(747)-C(5))-methyltransferase RlmC [Sulfuricurvum sp.]
MSFCSFYDTDACRSCSMIDLFYGEQLNEKGALLHKLLHPFEPKQWLKPSPSQLKGFRNKAKMVAIPSRDGIVLGLSEESSLIQCPLYDVSMQHALGQIQTWLRELKIQAYDVRVKKGELKYVLLTRSAHNGTMMLRFVLRSHGIIGRLKNGLDDLVARVPKLTVITVNIQPIHMAILEGEEEIFLTDQTRLEENLNSIPLFIRPKSFFQTNTDIATKLYKTASEWAGESKPKIIWDLFCGVGGFALHCATPERHIVGIEIEAEAIACAQESAKRIGFENLTFKALDAASFGAESGERADVIIVNPPRRGLGEQLCKWLERVGSERILYSSCNAQSLAKDLENLSGYRVNRVQLFDMFPHTAHFETLVELVKN